MIGHTTDYASAVKGPNTGIVRCEVWRSGAMARTLDIHSGRVEADRANNIMRRFTASVTDPLQELTPVNLKDLMAPFGTVIKLFRGIRLPKVAELSRFDDTQADFNAGTLSGAVGDVLGDLVLTGGSIHGTRVAPPLALPGGPIASSFIRWHADGLAFVDTSVDNGATWQPAVSGGPVPRLVRGTSVAQAVLTRITLDRSSTSVATPRLHDLELRVSVESSRDELMPLGAFTLNDVDIVDNSSGIYLDISGNDFSRKISRARWTSTLVIPEGTNYGDAIRTMVGDRLPGAQFNMVSTDIVTPRLFFGANSNNDPWTDIADAAAACGNWIYFDPFGVCTMKEQPNPDKTEPVHVFESTQNPVINDVKRSVTDRDTYNYVIVIAEGSTLEEPLQAISYDDDPNSPTYWLGDYGVVADIWRTSLITDPVQAQLAADARLLKSKGATETAAISTLVHAALEPGDVVGIQRNRSKLDGRFILDSITTPLGQNEDQQHVGRRLRVA